MGNTIGQMSKVKSQAPLQAQGYEGKKIKGDGSDWFFLGFSENIIGVVNTSLRY